VPKTERYLKHKVSAKQMWNLKKMYATHSNLLTLDFLLIGITENQVWFKNPANAERAVHVFADPPHMLKLIRNHLIDDGLVLSDGSSITKETLNELLLFDQKELRLCPKIGVESLELRGSERMRVRRAAELL